jgi:23S rRNA (adenine2503-C2)-methyltransferase
MGFSRNLSCDEMLSAAKEIYNYNKNDEADTTSILLTGMGEPLFNYDEVYKLYKLAFGNMMIEEFILSTSGIADKIIELANSDIDYKLCYSLHTPFDNERDELIPINRKYNIKETLDACKYYHEKKNRKISISYTLIKGVNDDESHINELIKILNEKERN